MKNEYKELRKHLKDSYPPIKGNTYELVGGVGLWLVHSDIPKPNATHLKVIFNIFGRVPYPFQIADRKVILDYLKSHKYKEFKDEFIKSPKKSVKKDKKKTK